MQLRELNTRMRAFEASADMCVPTGVHMVARLDGRGFTKLTRDVLQFDEPYHEQFRDHMVATTDALMRNGLHVVYAYTQGDEISLLFHRDETGFGRRLRKYNSVLAGIASAVFSLRVQTLATFDCRISQLPTIELVEDYFLWRDRDAQRNALNTRCCWQLHRQGYSPKQISAALHGLTAKQKTQLLASEHDFDFSTALNWQRRGVGVYWKPYKKQLTDEHTGEVQEIERRRLFVDVHLPAKSRYRRFIREKIERSLTDEHAVGTP